VFTIAWPRRKQRPLSTRFSDPNSFQPQRSKIEDEYEDEFEDDLLAATPPVFYFLKTRINWSSISFCGISR
jgi:hypothetical protein